MGLNNGLRILRTFCCHSEVDLLDVRMSQSANKFSSVMTKCGLWGHCALFFWPPICYQFIHPFVKYLKKFNVAQKNFPFVSRCCLYIVYCYRYHFKICIFVYIVLNSCFTLQSSSPNITEDLGLSDQRLLSVHRFRNDYGDRASSTEMSYTHYRAHWALVLDHWVSG